MSTKETSATRRARRAAEQERRIAQTVDLVFDQREAQGLPRHDLTNSVAHEVARIITRRV